MPPRGITPVEIDGGPGGTSGSATFDGLTDVNPAGKADTYVVTWDAGSGKYKVLPASGGAPASASYVTVSAESGLSAETLITAYLMPPDTLANRPAAGTAGRNYFASDTNQWYYDTGSVWTALSPVPTLPNVGPGVTTSGTAARSVAMSIDAKGRVTALTDVAIAIPESAVTGLVSDLAGKAPSTGIAESAITGLVSDLAAKAPVASPTFTGTVTIPTGASITAPTGLVKADVGLSNVDNVADSAKAFAASQITSGQLGVARGGTGAATLTAHGVVIGEGTSAVAVTSAGTSGQVLTSGGASADPSFQNVDISAIANGAIVTILARNFLK